MRGVQVKHTTLPTAVFFVYWWTREPLHSRCNMQERHRIVMGVAGIDCQVAIGCPEPR